jgi:hypothetical protein
MKPADRPPPPPAALVAAATAENRTAASRHTPPAALRPSLRFLAVALIEVAAERAVFTAHLVDDSEHLSMQPGGGVQQRGIDRSKPPAHPSRSRPGFAQATCRSLGASSAPSRTDRSPPSRLRPSPGSAPIPLAQLALRCPHSRGKRHCAPAAVLEPRQRLSRRLHAASSRPRMGNRGALVPEPCVNRRP